MQKAQKAQGVFIQSMNIMDLQQQNRLRKDYHGLTTIYFLEEKLRLKATGQQFNP